MIHILSKKQLEILYNTYSNRFLSAALGISKRTLYKYLRKNGIPFKGRSKKGGLQMKQTPKTNIWQKPKK